MEKLQNFMWIIQSLLAIGQLAIMLYALKAFLSKPKNAIEQRVAALEVKVKEHDNSLHQGNDNFRAQTQTNEVLIQTVLALIEFEIQYCLLENKQPSPELLRAKENLQQYLSRK